MTIITRDQLLNLPDLETKIIDVPEFGEGCQLRLRSMSCKDQLEYEELSKDKTKINDLLLYLIIYCVVDEEDKQLFTADDIPLLKNKSSKTIMKLFEECINLSTLKKEDLETKAKNS